MKIESDHYVSVSSSRATLDFIRGNSLKYTYQRAFFNYQEQQVTFNRKSFSKFKAISGLKYSKRQIKLSKMIREFYEYFDPRFLLLRGRREIEGVRNIYKGVFELELIQYLSMKLI